MTTNSRVCGRCHRVKALIGGTRYCTACTEYLRAAQQPPAPKRIAPEHAAILAVLRKAGMIWTMTNSSVCGRCHRVKALIGGTRYCTACTEYLRAAQRPPARMRIPPDQAAILIAQAAANKAAAATPPPEEPLPSQPRSVPRRIGS